MTLKDDIIFDVYDSYKFSDGRIVAFLKSPHGKLPNQTVLADSTGCQWAIKQYFRVTGSVETYEKTEVEEAQNIFQYLLEGLNQKEKPAKGSKLKVVQSA
jgi:hypothetical protein